MLLQSTRQEVIIHIIPPTDMVMDTATVKVMAAATATVAATVAAMEVAMEVAMEAAMEVAMEAAMDSRSKV